MTTSLFALAPSLSLLCGVVNLRLYDALLTTKTRYEDLASSHVGPVEAFTTAWRKSFTYGGKATRAEYWWFYFINLIVIYAYLWLVPTSPPDLASALLILYSIASVFPSLSIVVRRLRDIGKQWQWIFISLIPFIGGIWFIVLMCQPSGKYEIGQASNM